MLRVAIVLGYLFLLSPIFSQPSSTIYPSLQWDTGDVVPGFCSVPGFFLHTPGCDLYICVKGKFIKMYDRSETTTFAELNSYLSRAGNGRHVYCVDCKTSKQNDWTCKGEGRGTIAFRIAGVNICLPTG